MVAHLRAPLLQRMVVPRRGKIKTCIKCPIKMVYPNWKGEECPKCFFTFPNRNGEDVHPSWRISPRSSPARASTPTDSAPSSRPSSRRNSLTSGCPKTSSPPIPKIPDFSDAAILKKLRDDIDLGRIGENLDVSDFAKSLKCQSSPDLAENMAENPFFLPEETTATLENSETTQPQTASDVPKPLIANSHYANLAAMEIIEDHLSGENVLSPEQAFIFLENLTSQNVGIANGNLNISEIRNRLFLPGTAILRKPDPSLVRRREGPRVLQALVEVAQFVEKWTAGNLAENLAESRLPSENTVFYEEIAAELAKKLAETTVSCENPAEISVETVAVIRNCLEMESGNRLELPSEATVAHGSSAENLTGNSTKNLLEIQSETAIPHENWAQSTVYGVDLAGTLSENRLKLPSETTVTHEDLAETMAETIAESNPPMPSETTVLHVNLIDTMVEITVLQENLAEKESEIAIFVRNMTEPCTMCKKPTFGRHQFRNQNDETFCLSCFIAKNRPAKQTQNNDVIMIETDGSPQISPTLTDSTFSSGFSPMTSPNSIMHSPTPVFTIPDDSTPPKARNVEIVDLEKSQNSAFLPISDFGSSETSNSEVIAPESSSITQKKTPPAPFRFPEGSTYKKGPVFETFDLEISEKSAFLPASTPISLRKSLQKKFRRLPKERTDSGNSELVAPECSSNSTQLPSVAPSKPTPPPFRFPEGSTYKKGPVFKIFPLETSENSAFRKLLRKRKSENFAENSEEPILKKPKMTEAHQDLNRSRIPDSHSKLFKPVKLTNCEDTEKTQNSFDEHSRMYELENEKVLSIRANATHCSNTQCRQKLFSTYVHPKTKKLVCQKCYTHFKKNLCDWRPKRGPRRCSLSACREKTQCYIHPIKKIFVCCHCFKTAKARMEVSGNLSENVAGNGSKMDTASEIFEIVSEKTSENQSSIDFDLEMESGNAENLETNAEISDFEILEFESSENVDTEKLGSENTGIPESSINETTGIEGSSFENLKNLEIAQGSENDNDIEILAENLLSENQIIVEIDMEMDSGSAETVEDVSEIVETEAEISISINAENFGNAETAEDVAEIPETDDKISDFEILETEILNHESSSFENLEIQQFEFETSPKNDERSTEIGSKLDMDSEILTEIPTIENQNQIDIDMEMDSENAEIAEILETDAGNFDSESLDIEILEYESPGSSENLEILEIAQFEGITSQTSQEQEENSFEINLATDFEIQADAENIPEIGSKNNMDSENLAENPILGDQNLIDFDTEMDSGCADTFDFEDSESGNAENALNSDSVTATEAEKSEISENAETAEIDVGNAVFKITESEIPKITETVTAETKFMKEHDKDSSENLENLEIPQNSTKAQESENGPPPENESSPCEGLCDKKKRPSRDNTGKMVCFGCLRIEMKESTKARKVHKWSRNSTIKFLWTH